MASSPVPARDADWTVVSDLNDPIDPAIDPSPEPPKDRKLDAADAVPVFLSSPDLRSLELLLPEPDFVEDGGMALLRVFLIAQRASASVLELKMAMAA